MTQGIEPVTRTNVSPGTTGSYQDVDISSYVPAGAEGVVLEIINTGASEYDWGVRKNGSADTIDWDIRVAHHYFCAIGVDANRVFEATIEDAAVEIYLLGYVPDGAGAFLTTAVNKTPGTPTSWEDVDISSDTGGDTAKIAFFQCMGHISSSAQGLRENGSTTALTGWMLAARLEGQMMAVDANEVLEIYVGTTDHKYWLVGWINSGYADSWPNWIDYSTATTGSWVDTALTDIGNGSKGAFLTFRQSSGSDYGFGIRKDGETYDNRYDLAYTDIQTLWCEVDAQKEVEQYIENVAVDLYLWGYVKEGEEPPPSTPASAVRLKLILLRVL